MRIISQDNTYAPTGNKEQEKIKVESIDVIVTGQKEKPYYAIKYKEVGSNDDCIGYGSYSLEYVFGWKEQCFELIEQENNDFGKWIPCSEKLPKDNTDVIVCFYSGTVTEMRYWGNGIFQGIYEHTAKTIVAWMTLPEPYKGE